MPGQLHNGNLQMYPKFRFLSVLFQQKTLDEKGIVFLDPNGLSADGTTFIRGSKFSRDGKIFAYGLSEKGSDWTTIKVNVYLATFFIISLLFARDLIN